MYPRLLKLTDLPPAAQKIARKLVAAKSIAAGPAEFRSRMSLVKALRAPAADEAQPAEFSYAALALMIEELSFTQSYQGILVYYSALGLPADEHIEFVEPLTAEHP